MGNLNTIPAGTPVTAPASARLPEPETTSAVPVVFSLKADHLTDRLVPLLGADSGICAIRTFPDGETCLRIHSDVRGRDCWLVACLDHPNGALAELILCAGALRDQGAHRLNLLVPYLPYMRQDKEFRPGESVAARHFSRFLDSMFDRIITVDPHLHRIDSLSRLFTIPSQVVAAADAIAPWIRSRVPDAVLIGPDSESRQWTSALAALTGCPWDVMEKTRHGDRCVSLVAPDLRRHQGKTPVLVDDIISSGVTMAQAAVALRRAGFGAPICLAVHALFADGAMETLQSAGVRQIATTNTVKHPTNQIDLTADLASAIRGRHDEHRLLLR